MKAIANPYDELPYVSLPIEWTAPEKIGLASLLRGGPRVDFSSFRVLEIGCGNGANLIPLAFYRRNGTFIGLDSARSQIDLAADRASRLDLENLDFIAADLTEADDILDGRFDFIIAHGVFSWVPEPTRDALLAMCQSRLADCGLLYLNYNCLPGWSIRGMVRDFLVAQTRDTGDLGGRAQSAKRVAADMAAAFDSNEHPYSRLMANEFRLAADSHVSYVGHEYLAADNHPYWRSDFASLVARYGFEIVADADFNYPEQSIPDDLESSLEGTGIRGRALEDTLDLLCYRQIHSPILSHGPIRFRAPDSDEFARLEIASGLIPTHNRSDGGRRFDHPNGYRVEIDDPELEAALVVLYERWPNAAVVESLGINVSDAQKDLVLLYRNGLIDLRITGVAEGRNSSQLNDLEKEWSGYVTTSRHVRESP